MDDSAADAELAPELLVGVVETALAEALLLAARDGRWGIVAQLAEELAARRRARNGDEPASADCVADRRGAR